MKKIFIPLFTISTLLMSSQITLAQEGIGFSMESLDQKYLNWYNLGEDRSKIKGASVDKAYEVLLQGREAKKKIIVAVIDAGVDIEHEDLQGQIWQNTNEIPNNGIDDDQNGYIDDIHGWNFIGNSEGENIKYENTEEVRIYRNLRPLFDSYRSIEEVAEDQKEDYTTYLSCKIKYQENRKKYVSYDSNLAKFKKNLELATQIVKDYLKVDSLSESILRKSSTTDNERASGAKQYLLKRYEQGVDLNAIIEAKESNDIKLHKYWNLEYTPRDIIADNPDEMYDMTYGNNDVKWERSDHGTFVAGIIAANRNNALGIDGIAKHVEIMVLRTVPIGDERDKDVALSIRYAVDNGANIINMSFGKNYSPQKNMVDEAIKYAEEHNVLMVHAAGNDAVNVDIQDRFPQGTLNNGYDAKTWINVGAHAMKLNKRFCGTFSNYGHENVDIFAPGVDILSLYPENTYLVASGTSFASPVVSGVAALVWSYYPELSAEELKNILLESSSSFAKKKVYYPTKGSDKAKKTRFKNLSKTGGIINAYQALQLAEERLKTVANQN